MKKDFPKNINHKEEKLQEAEMRERLISILHDKKWVLNCNDAQKLIRAGKIKINGEVVVFKRDKFSELFKTIREKILLINIKQILKDDNTGHGLNHAVETYNYAKKIINDEIIGNINLDKDSILVAALVHDVERLYEKKTGRSHYGPEALEQIEELLLKSYFNEKEILPILELVKVHDITSWEKLKTLPREAQILVDADNLGALGFAGLRRTLQFAKDKNEILYSPNSKTRCTIKHIEDYVMNVHKCLLTPKAKKIATPLIKEVRSFINEFYKEYYETKVADYSMKVFERFSLI